MLCSLLLCSLLLSSLLGRRLFGCRFFCCSLLGSRLLFGSSLLGRSLFRCELLGSGELGLSALLCLLLLECRLGLGLKLGTLGSDLLGAIACLLRCRILHKDPAAAEFNLDRVRSALAIVLADRRRLAARHGNLAGTVGRSALLAQAVQQPALVSLLNDTVCILHLNRCRAQLAQQRLGRNVQLLGKLRNCCCHGSDLLLAPGD